jgi:hypothetical protein
VNAAIETMLELVIVIAINPDITIIGHGGMTNPVQRIVTAIEVGIEMTAAAMMRRRIDGAQQAVGNVSMKAIDRGDVTIRTRVLRPDEIALRVLTGVVLGEIGDEQDRKLITQDYCLVLDWGS